MSAEQLTTLAGFAVFFLALLGYLRSMKNDLRSDLAATEARLDRRIDETKVDLTAKIDGVEERLTARIDGVEKALTARIDGVEHGLTGRMDRIDGRLVIIEQRTYDIGRVLPPPRAS